MLLGGAAGGTALLDKVCTADGLGYRIKPCIGWLGFGLASINCEHVGDANTVCDRAAMPEHRAKCRQGVKNSIKLSSPVPTGDTAGVRKCLEMAGDPGGGTVGAEESMTRVYRRLLRVVDCNPSGNGPVLGCCGDGECAWAETPSSCPGDCAAGGEAGSSEGRSHTSAASGEAGSSEGRSHTRPAAGVTASPYVRTRPAAGASASPYLLWAAGFMVAGVGIRCRALLARS